MFIRVFIAGDFFELLLGRIKTCYRILFHFAGCIIINGVLSGNLSLFCTVRCKLVRILPGRNSFKNFRRFFICALGFRRSHSTGSFVINCIFSCDLRFFGTLFGKLVRVLPTRNGFEHTISFFIRILGFRRSHSTGSLVINCVLPRNLRFFNTFFGELVRVLPARYGFENIKRFFILILGFCRIHYTDSIIICFILVARIYIGYISGKLVRGFFIRKADRLAIVFTIVKRLGLIFQFFTAAHL